MIEKKKLLIASLLLLMSGILSVCLQIRSGGLQPSTSLPRNLPMEAAGWQGSPFTAAMPNNIEPGDFILRAYQRNSGGQVNMLALYSPISNYHPPALCYQGSGRRLTEIPSLTNSSGNIRLAGLMGKSDSETILIYHGFYISRRMIPDGMEKKIYEAKERLTHGHIKQYFFEVTISAVNDDVDRATSYIRRFLDDMEPYLLRVS
jgi:hypothetical protein